MPGQPAPWGTLHHVAFTSAQARLACLNLTVAEACRLAAALSTIPWVQKACREKPEDCLLDDVYSFPLLLPTGHTVEWWGRKMLVGSPDGRLIMQWFTPRLQGDGWVVGAKGK